MARLVPSRPWLAAWRPMGSIRATQIISGSKPTTYYLCTQVLTGLMADYPGLSVRPGEALCGTAGSNLKRTCAPTIATHIPAPRSSRGTTT
jgi:hypothetical protein